MGNQARAPRKAAARAGSVAVVLIAVTLVASTARADILGDLAQSFRGALEGGSLWVALGIVFAAGLATALTPCVYPMIAITVSVFGAKQAKTRGQASMLALVFIHGIAALFVPMGVIAALTGGFFGDPLTNKWVVGFLFTLFLAMGASMLGAFNMNLPPALQNKLAQVGGAGYGGAFLVGLVSGVVAAPCTGPVLAVLLAWIGTTSSPWFGGLALYVYSLGLGTLFFLVATFAMSLPKSGPWLDGVKSVFGIVMVLMAFYFGRSFFPEIYPVQRSVAWMLLAGAAVLAGLGIGAVHLSFHGETKTKVRKGVGIALTLGGLFSGAMWLHALPAGAHIEWLEDYHAAKSLALATERPLLVDFGADWCNACTELEHTAMSDPRVVAEARRFVPVRIDLSADQVTEEKREILSSYNQNGLPLVVMHCPNGNEAHRITGLVGADEFLAMMQATQESSHDNAHPRCREQLASDEAR